MLNRAALIPMTVRVFAPPSTTTAVKTLPPLRLILYPPLTAAVIATTVPRLLVVAVVANDRMVANNSRVTFFLEGHKQVSGVVLAEIYIYNPVG